MLEELGIDYDAHGLLSLDSIFDSDYHDTMAVINIGKGEQFTSGFVAVNPNSKIPCAIDRNGPCGMLLVCV